MLLLNQIFATTFVKNAIFNFLKSLLHTNEKVDELLIGQPRQFILAPSQNKYFRVHEAVSLLLKYLGLDGYCT